MFIVYQTFFYIWQYWKFWKVDSIRRDYTVPDHVAFLNQVTCSGNLVQTELPIEWKQNQITFGWTVLPSRDSPVFPQMQIAKGDVFS